MLVGVLRGVCVGRGAERGGYVLVGVLRRVCVGRGAERGMCW